MAKWRGRPVFCCYCKRDLDPPTANTGLARTKDHVMPQSLGGTGTKPCCRTCNNLKGDLHPSTWRWFTEAYPGWWKQFRTNSEVRRAIRSIPYDNP